MIDEQHIATRYLLGVLSEAERAQFEEEYFTNPGTFDEVVRTETELVDRYVRGGLSAEQRAQFERFYLTHPKQMERVRFAAALTARVDRREVPAEARAQPSGSESLRRQFPGSISGNWRILQATYALVAALIVVGGIWLFIENRDQRAELARTLAVQASDEQRLRELEQTLVSERRRAEELSAELEQQRQQPLSSTPPVRSIATLLLTVAGIRGGDAGPVLTLAIPLGTTQVRLLVDVKEVDYVSYLASLHLAGGEEVFSWQRLKPATTASGARITLALPASKLSNGDYILTLKGVISTGEIDDLSKSLFQVKKD